MDWMIYWLMLPVRTLIASAAMVSGISGAALLTPTLIFQHEVAAYLKFTGCRRAV